MEPERWDKGSIVQIESNWGKLIEVKNFDIIYSNIETVIWGCSVKNDTWEWKRIGMFKNSYFIKHPRVTPSDNEATIYLLQIIANETSKINILNIVLSIRLTARGFQIYCFSSYYWYFNVKINLFACEIYVETDLFFLHI